MAFSQKAKGVTWFWIKPSCQCFSHQNFMFEGAQGKCKERWYTVIQLYYPKPGLEVLGIFAWNSMNMSKNQRWRAGPSPNSTLVLQLCPSSVANPTINPVLRVWFFIQPQTGKSLENQLFVWHCVVHITKHDQHPMLYHQFPHWDRHTFQDHREARFIKQKMEDVINSRALNKSWSGWCQDRSFWSFYFLYPLYFFSLI